MVKNSLNRQKGSNMVLNGQQFANLFFWFCLETLFVVWFGISGISANLLYLLVLYDYFSTCLVCEALKGLKRSPMVLA